MIKKCVFSMLCLFIWFTSFSYDIKAATSSPPYYNNRFFLSLTTTNPSISLNNYGVDYPNSYYINKSDTYYGLKTMSLYVRFFSTLDKGRNVYYTARLKIYDNYGNIIEPSEINMFAPHSNGGQYTLQSNVSYTLDDDGFINILLSNARVGSNIVSDFQTRGVRFDFEFDYKLDNYSDYTAYLDFDYVIAVGGDLSDFYSYINNYFLFKGTSDSTTSSSALDDANENLGNAVSNYDEIEKGQVENFNNNIGNLDTTLGILNLSDFTTTAMWLSNQMTRIVTSNNVIQYMITFSLIIGFALVLIGRGLK